MERATGREFGEKLMGSPRLTTKTYDHVIANSQLLVSLCLRPLLGALFFVLGRFTDETSTTIFTPEGISAPIGPIDHGPFAAPNVFPNPGSVSAKT